MLSNYHLLVIGEEWNDEMPGRMPGVGYTTISVQQLSGQTKPASLSDRTGSTRQATTAPHSSDRTILITCSDAGIRLARDIELPVLAIRNPEYDRTHERQSLFGVPLLLEMGAEDGSMFDRDILDIVWYRSKHLPMPILDTARCHVREMAVPDLPELYALSGGRLREGDIFSREEFSEFWRAYIDSQYDFYGYGLWLVMADGRLIGVAGISNADYPFLPESEETIVELSYWIAPAYRRLGYAAEVCNAIVRTVENRFTIGQIHIFINEKNPASVRIAEMLGFHLHQIYLSAGEVILDYSN